MDTLIVQDIAIYVHESIYTAIHVSLIYDCSYIWLGEPWGCLTSGMPGWNDRAIPPYTSKWLARVVDLELNSRYLLHRRQRVIPLHQWADRNNERWLVMTGKDGLWAIWPAWFLSNIEYATLKPLLGYLAHLFITLKFMHLPLVPLYSSIHKSINKKDSLIPTLRSWL